MSDFGFDDVAEAYSNQRTESSAILHILALKEAGWSLEEIKKMPLSMFFKIGKYYQELNKEREKNSKR